ncbi:metabotropic glutamate receptor-like [Centruroides vittatus]|uniref:metabotropic glutamate receptor-like n=1 Tax=Centruroides vittatus TaxID=120091 RepID=UPI00350F5AA1
MRKILLLTLVILSMASIGHCQYCGQSVTPYVSRPGDVLLIGLFDINRGNRCDKLHRGGFEQMYSAAWFVDWLNNRSYTKGIRIGLNAYDTCTDTQNTLRLTVHGLSESSYLEKEECRSQYILGFIGPLLNPAKTSVSDFLRHLTITHMPFQLTALKYEIQALISALSHLEWKKVALLSSSESMRTYFHQRAVTARICVAASEVVDEHDITKFNHLFRLIEKMRVKVLVLLVTENDLLESLRTAKLYNLTRLYWLVAGPLVHSLSNLDIASSVSAMIIAQPYENNYPLITTSLIRKDVPLSPKGQKAMEEYTSLTTDCRLNASMSRNPLCRLLQMHILDSAIDSVLKTILKLADTLKNLQEQYCGSSWIMCTSLKKQFERKFWKIVPSMAFDIGNVNIIKEVIIDEKTIALWSYQPNSASYFNFVEVGRFLRRELQIDSQTMNILQPMGAGWYKIPDFQCTEDCACANYLSSIYSKGSHLSWRNKTWITICVTVSCTGTVMALAFACYIMIRICRRDTIEGNQGFALCILLGIICCYVSILPYGFDPSENICALRLLIGTAYTTLFAPILARCLMLATSDTGGLPGHISGLIQSSLYLFAVGVQAGLSAQYWWLNCGNHFQSAPPQCTASRQIIFISISYPALLLFFWLLISPFCVRSRRNYREGLTFQIASVLTLCVWVTWLSLSFIFPNSWRDPCLCLGVVASATVVLVSVFIPRIYKMATSIALDAVNVSLRPIGQMGAPNLTEMTVRDLQSMYDNASHPYITESHQATMKDDSATLTYEECPVNSSIPKTTHL